MTLNIRVEFENISGGLFMIGKKHGDMSFRHISVFDYITHFRKDQPDILALAEVPMEQEDGTSRMVEMLAATLGLPFYRCCYQSRSHLESGKYIGLAVLSKYAIENYRDFYLPNPGLRIAKSDGSEWTLFDKGVQQFTFNIQGKQLTLFNLHYFPFHHFNRRMNEDEFVGIRQELVDILLEEVHVPTIITGDFNNKGQPLSIAFPELFQEDQFRQAVETKTTVVGLCEQFDHILYTPTLLEVQHGLAKQKYSDHYAIIADITFKE
jgi:endonuclease/exonuclease/phosphatase family metal-dependent hydrolase